MTLHFIKISTNPETPGKIVSYTSITEEYAVGGFDYGIEVASKPDVLADYLLEGAVTPRPPHPATREGFVVSNIPLGSKLTITSGINMRTYDVEGDTVNLSFPNPGTYQASLSSWPYLDFYFEVVI